jgi:hypothetical protein
LSIILLDLDPLQRCTTNEEEDKEEKKKSFTTQKAHEVLSRLKTRSGSARGSGAECGSGAFMHVP